MSATPPARANSRHVVVTWEHPKTGANCKTICELSDSYPFETELPTILALARLGSVHDADDIVIHDVRELL